MVPLSEPVWRRHERATVSVATAAALASLFSIAATYILLGLALATLLASQRRLEMPPVWRPLGFFIAGTLVAWLAAGDLHLGFPQVKKLIAFAMLPVVYTALRTPTDGRRLVLLWAGGASLAAAAGIAQFAHKWVEAKALGRDFYAHYLVERSTGFMSHWMTFGGEQMMVLLAFAGLLIFARERGRAVGWACAGLLALSILLSFTRNAWAGLLVGGIYLLGQWRPRWLLALPLVLGVGYVISPEPVRARLTSLVRPRGQIDSNAHRVALWRTGVRMVKAHPWLGIGPERVSRRFLEFAPADIPRPLPAEWFVGHLHNIYLQFAADRGVPTLLALLWLIGSFAARCWRALRSLPPGPSAARGLLHGMVAMTLGVLVAGLFEHNLGDSEVLLLFLAAMAVGWRAAEAAGPPPGVRPPLPPSPS